jgi:hypothetical protein
VLLWVATGQIIRGLRDRPSAETHSIAVIKVRFTPAPLCVFNSCLPTRTLSELRTLRRTTVSSMLCISSENYRAHQLFSNYGEPVYSLIIYITIMSVPIYCFHSHSFKLWVAFTEGLWPILSGRFDIITIGPGDLENGRTLKHDNMC